VPPPLFSIGWGADHFTVVADALEAASPRTSITSAAATPRRVYGAPFDLPIFPPTSNSSHPRVSGLGENVAESQSSRACSAEVGPPVEQMSKIASYKQEVVVTVAVEEINFWDKVRIEVWSEPAIDKVGHDARSAYVEQFWLPILGPSTTWLLRSFASALEQSPGGCDLDLAETARSLGLGERTGRHAPFLRCVARAIDFNMASLRGPKSLAVRRYLPTLERRQLLRLPAGRRAEHDKLVNNDSVDAVHQRARRLALSLYALGESEDEVERALIGWHFHPSLASSSSRWGSAEFSRGLLKTKGGAAEQHPSSTPA
jgi:hypothetical protein